MAKPYSQDFAPEAQGREAGKSRFSIADISRHRGQGQPIMAYWSRALGFIDETWAKANMMYA